MLRRLVALLLALLVAVPAGAAEAAHRCGELVVLSCACEHGGASLTDGQDDACCSDIEGAPATPSVVPDAPAPAALDVADHAFVPTPEPPVRLLIAEEARPGAPPRGPPPVPIFLRNRALLN